MIIFSPIYVAENGIISFFNIPLCICTVSSLSVNGHLGSFHVLLAIVNNLAMSTRVHESFQTLLFSDIWSVVGLLYHIVVLFSVS